MKTTTNPFSRAEQDSFELADARDVVQQARLDLGMAERAIRRTALPTNLAGVEALQDVAKARDLLARAAKILSIAKRNALRS